MLILVWLISQINPEDELNARAIRVLETFFFLKPLFLYAIPVTHLCLFFFFIFSHFYYKFKTYFGCVIGSLNIQLYPVLMFC